ncbi:MAG: adenylosuccinate lyase [Candidatus Cloacimonetes bacterium]|nr:adenylosuccinate lyase [Candidatus Cloacimonadota bacterium]
MIERYTRPEMGGIWELENKYRCWLKVELAACRAMNRLDMIPDDDLIVILDKADFDVGRIAEIEAETHHDVIAFLTSVAEHVGPASRWVHYGMTSSDVLDTAIAIQLRQAGELLLAGLASLAEALRQRARKHRDLLCVGRSHGIHAEPTIFGLKFALWFDEIQRDIKRLERAIETVSVGQISGAVGNYAHISPEVETIACEYLELKAVNIATQVIQRDRHAEFCSTLAIIAGTLEKIALEVRHLQRTEVLEAAEGFAPGQKGSSAMPHKKNPIISERICGLSRVIRSNAHTAFENIALWHERDISHSSVERVILPDSTILLDYMLSKTIDLVERLEVYPERMMHNLELTNGLVFSQALLLALAERGVTRETAYSMVQRNAMKCWEQGTPLRTLIEADTEIMALLGNEALADIFSYDRYSAQVDFIFQRVGL